MGRPPIPRVLDDLRDDWLSSVLGRDVGACSVERIGEGVGILGVIARITLGDRTTLVAKIGSDFEETIQLVTAYGFYLTEAGFYRDVAHRDLGLRLAGCLYVDVSESGDAVVLLLEDLGGGRTFDQIAGCPLEMAERVVDSIATFHAHWWDSPELHSMTWLRPLNNPAYKAGQATYQQVFPLLVEKHDGRWTGAAMDIARRWGEQLPEMYDVAMAASPLTIAHTDLRLDNLFFDLPDGSPFAVLDWQLTVRAPGAFDVSYFCAESLTIADRRAHEEALVRRWHGGLVESGVTGYSFDAAWADYRRALVMQMSIPVVGSFMPMANQRAEQLVDVMLDRAMTALDDHRPVEFFLD